MSLFRKPKKQIQRRVFSGYDEDESENGISTSADVIENNVETSKTKKKDKRDKKEHKSKALLSFADDEEEDEVFQVKKSSYSKKVMRMLDKERKRKKGKEDKTDNVENALYNVQIKENPSQSNTDISQTEIHTDDFVLVVKKSESENLILNGRAALCAGRNDMSSEEEDNISADSSEKHSFTKPDSFKLLLESGSIPNAAMIHAARKRRQKARELGDFIPVEEPKEVKKGNRLVREDAEEDGSEEEERVDMNAITGIKEREERREHFYSVEREYSGDESDQEMHEWENQQIRKGVTGAQLVTAQHESVLSHFVIKSTSSYEENIPPSTGTLLEQAYAKSCLEKPRQILLSTQKSEMKPTGPRTPLEVVDALNKRLTQLRELNMQHKNDINKITENLKIINQECINLKEIAPTCAKKYCFYQDIRGYITDLIECLDEKAPEISALEKKTINILSKHANYVIERRRQDLRDQAKETSESLKQGFTKRNNDDEEFIRRVAEREGRRNRRRFEREKNNYINSHLDGMSSDDELGDQELSQYRNNLEKLEIERDNLFDDTFEDFYKIERILYKFESWRKTDMDSYKEAYVSLCLPKILGQIIRVEIMVWNPLDENYHDIDKMDWYISCMKYAWSEEETEESLGKDPDVKLVPWLIERFIIPKITDIIENCWDPLSSTKTLRLIGLIGRLGREYPTLHEDSKPFKNLFNAILEKMKSSLENDIFIPIFPKQFQEAKTSFFQRQFCSALKLFRNLLSWQGIISEQLLKEFAICALLNRYLLSAMKICSIPDALTKAYIIVNTLPTAWMQQDSEILDSLSHFITFVKNIFNQLSKKNPTQVDLYDKAKQILQRLHTY